MFIIKQKLYGKFCRAFSAYFVTSAKEEISFPDFFFARILYAGKTRKRRGKDGENKRKRRGKQASPVLRLCCACFDYEPRGLLPARADLIVMYECMLVRHEHA